MASAMCACLVLITAGLACWRAPGMTHSLQGVSGLAMLGLIALSCASGIARRLLVPLGLGMVTGMVVLGLLWPQPEAMLITLVGISLVPWQGWERMWGCAACGVVLRVGMACCAILIAYAGLNG
ncbi:MAG: hypothetical protein EA401_08025 [Planctomycetota bacterium]|nr:MAG: hypothetical protein EA401_08025 [Planctomycetota bacterium]